MEEKKPTVVPADEFNADEDALKLNEAFQGFGTNEDVVTSILAGRGLQQRQSIKEAYKAKFGKDLVSELQSEVSGNYLMALEGLVDDPLDFHTKYIHKVITGPITGCSDISALEALCPLNDYERSILASTYAETFGKTLKEDIKDKVSGPFKFVVEAMAEGGNLSSSLSQAEVESDTNTLVSLTPDDWIPENTQLIEILVKRNPMTSFSVITAYKGKTDKDLLEVATTEPKEAYREGFKILVSVAQDKWMYFANQLYQSMKGIGTDDSKLIYIIVYRCEMDLGNIAEVFQQMFNCSLQSFIRNDTSGDYGNLLLSLIGPETEAKA